MQHYSTVWLITRSDVEFGRAYPRGFCLPADDETAALVVFCVPTGGFEGIGRVVAPTNSHSRSWS